MGNKRLIFLDIDGVLNKNKLKNFCELHQLDFSAFEINCEFCYFPLLEEINRLYQTHSPQTLVVGINAPQGAGKTTLSELFQLAMSERFNLCTLSVSIDDFYFDKSKRKQLAQKTHPLLATRGVPGTHDVPALINFITTVSHARQDSEIVIPQFDKALDDRVDKKNCRQYRGQIDVLFLEGWCVGSIPIKAEQLKSPINELEKHFDQEGIWRQYWNSQLRNQYRDLFKLIDFLVCFNAPDWQTVISWRQHQEQRLITKLVKENIDVSNTMNKKQLMFFMQHFERLTRHNMRSMKTHSDRFIQLNANREPT